MTSSSASASVRGAIRNSASPISSASTPPGPKATSGPNTGSWTTPARSSALPLSIGWTSDGGADARCRGTHLLLVVESERDSARSPSCARRRRRSSRRPGNPVCRRSRPPRRRSRTAAPRRVASRTRSSSSRACAGVSQPSLSFASASATTRRAGGSVDPVELWYRAGRPAEPLGAPAASPSARAADSGYGKPADAGSGRAQLALGDERRASTGLSAPDDRPSDRRRRRPRRRRRRAGRRARSPSRPRGRRAGSRHHRLVARRRRRAEHVDRVCEAGLCRQQLGSCALRLGRAELRELETRPPRRRPSRGSPGRRRSSGARLAGRAAAAGSRAAPLRRSAPRASRARSTPAWWNSASTAASEPASAAVCEPAARAPVEVSALHRQDRLLARDAARDPAEAARVAERLEVERDQRSVVRPLPSTRGGRSTRRPPCSRSR